MAGIDKCVTYKPAHLVTDMKLRRVLTTHLHYIRNHESTVVHYVSQSEARPYYYDFYAYLRSQNILEELHWPTLIVNTMASPMLFDGSIKSILVPNMGVINDIISIARSR